MFPLRNRIYTQLGRHELKNTINTSEFSPSINKDYFCQFCSEHRDFYQISNMKTVGLELYLKTQYQQKLLGSRCL